MYQTLADMRKDLMGRVPGFSPNTYNEAIQRSYDDLVNGHVWNELETIVPVATKQYVNTGGAHFEQGQTDVSASTTVSAAWTGGEGDGFSGMWIIKRDDAYPNIITGSTSNNITLSSAYLGKTTTAAASSGDGYAIFKHIYTITEDIGDVISVVCEDHKLGKVTDKFLDKYDGDYQEEGEPDRWRMLGRDSSGYTRIQIYPALIDEVYLLRIRARRKIETLTDTTKPLLDSTLINAYAKVELLERKKLKDPNSVTDSQLQFAINNATDQFTFATERDRRFRTDEPYTLDNMFEDTHRGQDWIVTHDPWDR